MKQKSDAREEQAILRFQYELDAPPARVWRAITIPEYVVQWLHARPVAPETERPQPVLLDLEPNQSVRYLWSEEGDSTSDSIVTLRVAPNDTGGTTFSIVHELILATEGAANENVANNNRPKLLLAA
jgi:uncharacterized protein YndB with AHSA1/START domain